MGDEHHGFVSRHERQRAHQARFNVRLRESIPDESHRTARRLDDRARFLFEDVDVVGPVVDEIRRPRAGGVVVARRDDHWRGGDAPEEFPEESQRVEGDAVGLVEIARDDERRGTALARIVDDLPEALADLLALG